MIFLDYLFTKTPLAFLPQNLWRDEAFSYLMAQRSIPEIISMTVKDFSPPLYYIFLHYWILLFGSSELAMRSLSLLFYAFTLYAAYEIIVYIFKCSRLHTLLFMILFLLNPFLNYYAAEARMYMMVTFFVAVSYFALWKPYKITYIIAITAAFYTHYFAVFIYIAQWLPRFIVYFRSSYRSLHKLHTWKLFWKEFHMAIIPLLLFLPWMWYILISHDFSDNSFWIIVPPRKEILYIPFLLFTGYERVFGQYYHDKAGYTIFHTRMLLLLWTIFLLPVAASIVQLFTKQKLKPEEKGNRMVLIDVLMWAFFTPILIYILSYLTQPLFHPRYYIFASVGFMLLIVLAFQYAWRSKDMFIKVLGIGLFVVLLQWTWSFTKLNLKYRSKRTVAPMIQEIHTLLRPKDYVYTKSELDYHLVQYYLKDKKDQVKIYDKTYEEIPAYTGKVLIPREALSYYLPQFPSKAFVVHYNWYEIQSVF
jgi:uncharacterized membrane protein